MQASEVHPVEKQFFLSIALSVIMKNSFIREQWCGFWAPWVCFLNVQILIIVLNKFLN